MRVQRLSPNDLTTLATDRGPAPMNIAAILLLEQAAKLDLDAVQAVLADRLARVPRLRQRLFHPGWGCGRPVWVDDPQFDLGRHLDVREPRQPATVDTALADAAEVITTPLPRDRPLWRARLLTGLAGDGAALILVVHHVLADGLGGLAVLAALADGGPPLAAPAACGPGVPSRRMLAADAWRERAHGIRHPRRVVRVTVDGLRELGLREGRPRLAPRTSLNVPTGPHRGVSTVVIPLAAVVELGNQRGATVNDVVLTAIVGALAELLRARGEHPAELVVSVPVSARASASAGELGNRTGVA
ncbi:MAG: wax ester/triacylglycerol synthase domain-containing protein, partial [Candidatus Phosphoribacter sp.]